MTRGSHLAAPNGLVTGDSGGYRPADLWQCRNPGRSPSRVTARGSASIPVRVVHPPGEVLLQGLRPRFAAADADEAVHRHGPHLAVADLARPARLHDEVDDLVDIGGVDEDLDLDLGDEGHGVLRAAEHLALAPLAAVALDLTGGHAHDTGRPQGVFHFFEPVRLDHRRDEMDNNSPFRD